MLNVLGLVLIYGGFISTFWGIWSNNDISKQIINAIGTGNSGNSGTLWIIAGVIAVLLGTAIILVNTFKKPKKRY